MVQVVLIQNSHVTDNRHYCTSTVHYIRTKSVLLLKQNDKKNVLAKNKQNSVTKWLEIYTTLTYTHVTSTRNQKRNLKENEYTK